MDSNIEISDNVFAYTEAEAAEALKLKSERVLAEFRRKYLSIGKHYSKIGRDVRYTPEHLRAILNLDKREAA